LLVAMLLVAGTGNNSISRTALSRIKVNWGDGAPQWWTKEETRILGSIQHLQAESADAAQRMADKKVASGSMNQELLLSDAANRSWVPNGPYAMVQDGQVN
jgi:hypothetical protein